MLCLCCYLQAFSSCSAQCLGVLQSTDSGGSGLQPLWLPGSRARAQELWCTGLVALQHVRSSRTRNWTCVSCIGRHIFHLELNISILDLFSTREEISLEFYTYNMCIEKARELKKNTSISALLTMPKPLTVWITINCGKFWKRWEFQTTWPASWETCMQVSKQQLELDMEQQTASK